MIRFDDVHAIKLIAQACNVQFVPTLHHCAARYNDQDQLMGGMLFTDFMGGSIQIHVAGFKRNWCNRELLYIGANYPFEVLKVKKMIAQVPEYNLASVSFCLHWGWTAEYLVEDVFNYRDRPNGMWIFGIRKEDCRWLAMKPPHIEVVPLDRTNRIDHQLSVVDHTQMTRQ